MGLCPGLGIKNTKIYCIEFGHSYEFRTRLIINKIKLSKVTKNIKYINLTLPKSQEKQM